MNPHRWKPGQTGNPVGRKTNRDRAALQRSLRELLSPYASEAVQVLVQLMRESDDDKVRRSAADSILDRVYGRANQVVHMTVDEEAKTMTDDELVVAARDILERVGLVN